MLYAFVSFAAYSLATVTKSACSIVFSCLFVFFCLFFIRQIRVVHVIHTNEDETSLPFFTLAGQHVGESTRAGKQQHSVKHPDTFTCSPRSSSRALFLFIFFFFLFAGATPLHTSSGYVNEALLFKHISHKRRPSRSEVLSFIFYFYFFYLFIYWGKRNRLAFSNGDFCCLGDGSGSLVFIALHIRYVRRMFDRAGAERTLSKASG
jgi:hypothetical protein